MAITASKKTHSMRDRTSKAFPAPEANAELQVNIDVCLLLNAKLLQIGFFNHYSCIMYVCSLLFTINREGVLW